MNIGAIGGYTPVSYVNPYAISGAISGAENEKTFQQEIQ